MSTLTAYTGVLLLMNANAFLHYVSKIPGIGPALTRNYFKKQKTKTLVSFLGFLWGFIKAAIGTNVLLYIALYWVPEFLTRGDYTMEYIQGIAMVAFILLFNVNPLLEGTGLFAATREDNTFLNHFGLNPDQYYRYKSLKGILLEPVLRLPVLIYLFRAVHPVLFAFALSLLTPVIGEVLSLASYKRFGKILPRRLRSVVQILLIVVTYALIYLRRLPVWLPSPTVAYVTLALAVLGFVFYVTYLQNYSNFKAIAVNFARGDIANVTVTVSTSLTEGDTGLAAHTPEDNKAFYEANKDLNPIAYIETAFRARFAKILKRKTKDTALQQIFTGVIIGVLIVAGLLKPDGSDWIRYTPIGISFVLMMGYAMDYLVLCFRNVDRIFLAQHLYNKEDMQRNMKQRIKSILIASIPRLLIMAIFLVIIVLFWGIRPDTLTAAKVFLAYVLIYYIYELFSIITYYAVMPYSTELQIKSPAFMILQFLIGLFGIYFLFARANVILLLPGLAITLAVLIVVLVVVYLNIDKTFKLRY